MKLTPALVADLTSLTAALDDPDVDLQCSLDRLGRTLGTAISSFLGLSMTVRVDDHPITVTTTSRTAAPATVAGSPVVGASISLPLPERAATVVFYAGSPGAFVDLAADVTHAWTLPPGAVVIDAQLTPDPDCDSRTEVGGLAEFDVVHQAVGVLVGRGHLPAAAHHELDQQARTTGVDVIAAAHAILDSTWPSTDPTPL